MGRPRILDEKIMSKIAKKTGKRDIVAVNGMVSKKADKLGISAEAALIILAKEHGIGTSAYQRSLESSKQDQVRDTLPTIFAVSQPVAREMTTRKASIPTNNKRTILKAAIEYLIQDDELRDRCGDLLLAGSKFDRPINQATLVLEERIRQKSTPTAKLTGEGIVNFAFNENLSKTVLQVPGADSDEQRGFTQILRGVVAAFRNKTHHHISDTFTREDALRVCGLIDVLLRVVDGSTKIR